MPTAIRRPIVVSWISRSGKLASLTRLLALDPRPHYHDDASRVYGMPFAGRDIHFQVQGQQLIVLDH